MKEVLFDLLEKIEPYNLIKLSIGNNEMYVCRDNAYFPMAVRFLEYEPEMSRSNYFYTYEPNDVTGYVDSHKITLDNNDYLIETELTTVEYYDDHIYIELNGIVGTSKYYVSYDSINYMSISSSNTMAASSRLVMQYNKLQYEMNGGDRL